MWCGHATKREKESTSAHLWVLALASALNRERIWDSGWKRYIIIKQSWSKYCLVGHYWEILEKLLSLWYLNRSNQISSSKPLLPCRGVFEGGSAVPFLGVNFTVEILWIGSGLAEFQGGWEMKDSEQRHLQKWRQRCKLFSSFQLIFEPKKRLSAFQQNHFLSSYYMTN
jgi:hypothetical protein